MGDSPLTMIGAPAMLTLSRELLAVEDKIGRAASRMQSAHEQLAGMKDAAENEAAATAMQITMDTIKSGLFELGYEIKKVNS